MAKPKFLKIGQIGGMFYSCGVKTSRIIVYAIGGPTVPDNGYLPDAPFVLTRGLDLFVPDYLGFGRSDGVFTPRNCIRTLVVLFNAFKNGCKGVSYYDNKIYDLKYSEVLFVGRSLGGAYVPLLPKFNKEINKLAIFCPAVDQSAQGKVKGEETNEDFMCEMEKGGYHHLYRGVLKGKVWWNHLEDKDGLSPMDNITYLSNTKLFIAHGKFDKCIHYSKSVAYYKKILEIFPDKKDQFSLKLYPLGDHGSSTTSLAIRDCLMYFNL